jgi:alpha-amylase
VRPIIRLAAVPLAVLLATGCATSTPTASAPGEPSAGAGSPSAVAATSSAGAGSPSAVAATSSAGAGSPSATPPAATTAAPGSACTPPADPATHDWNGRVWYEAFVRSFADGNGDGIGDLRGLTAKLDYLNDGDPSTSTDLGVTGIWLMPIAQSPSYHGYDVVDYEQVEHDYGTNADAKAFIAAAHERGISVIVDLVMNHTSDRHPWFKDAIKPGSRHDAWYVWSDTKPTWLGPGGEVVWHPAGRRWYYGVFSDAMPDLDLRNPAVTKALEGVARFWLDDVGVDGFRLDAAKHLIEDGKDAQTNTPETKAWLAGFKASVDAAKPGALLVGEVWDPATTAGSYVPDSLDMTFNFGMATGIRLALQNGRAAPLVTALDDTLRAWPANQSATFLANHDQARIMNGLYGDAASAKLAAFLLLTSPGTPFLYYGEEIGMTGTKPDERIRTPMRWTADPATAGFTTGTPWEALSDDDPAAVNVETQSADPGSLLSTYRALIALREASPALAEGATVRLEGGAEPVTGWLRTRGGETVVAVVNVSDEPVSQYGLMLAEGPLCGPVTARVLASVGLRLPGDAPSGIAAPTVTASGGVEAWRPFPELPPRSGFLVALEPAP